MPNKKKKKISTNKGIDLKKLSKQRRALVYGCIKNFFYTKLPLYAKLSNTKKMKIKLRGKNINSLGVEGALESFIELFKDGRLKMEIEDKDNFVVYTVNRNEVIMLHRVVEGKIKY